MMNRHLWPAASAFAFAFAACRRAEPTAHDEPAPVTQATPIPSASASARAGTCSLPSRCEALLVPSSSTLTLERTECFGDCPAYSVTIHADGTVSWNGTENVLRKGAQTAKVDPAEVRVLFDFATTSCFFAMNDQYRYPVTDKASAIVKLSLGAKSKEVTVYPSDKASWDSHPPAKGTCPPSDVLFDLAERIDKVAGTTRWIGKR